MKKRIFIFLFSIFSIFLYSESVNALVPEAIGTFGLFKVFFDNNCLDSSCTANHNTIIQSYDADISAFDKYGDDIVLMSNCDSTYYIDNGVITTTNSNTANKLCDTNNGISLTNIKNYFNYYIHVNYLDMVDGKEYDTYLIFVNRPYLYEFTQTNPNSGSSSHKGLLMPESGNLDDLQGLVIHSWSYYSPLHFYDNGSPTAMGNINIEGISTLAGLTYTNGFVGWDGGSQTHETFSFNKHKKFDIYNLLTLYNNKFEYSKVTINTNFDLLDYGTNNVALNGDYDFIFNTDTDIRRYSNISISIKNKIIITI